MKAMLNHPNLKNKYFRTLVFLMLLFMLLGVACQILLLINHFYDIYTILPWKTFVGKDFSFEYPQNWGNTRTADDLPWISPQESLLYGFPGLMNSETEPQDYDSALFYLDREIADTHTSPDAGANQQRVWEQRMPEYRRINMPATKIIGSITWYQQAATYEIDPRDSPGIPMGEITLSTIYTTKDNSRVLFTLYFSSNSDIFNQVNSQVFQRILQSFVFHSD